MRKGEMHTSPDMILPEIEFSSVVTQVKRGESTSISWSVKGAEEATLWKSNLLPEAPEPLDWPGISRLGEKVKLSDKLELTAEKTIACYLVAKGPRGMCGSRIVIHVVQEKPGPARQARSWSPPQSLLGRMEQLAHVGWISRQAEFPSGSIFNDPEFVMKLAHTWDAPPTPPGIGMSASPQVIFEGETSTLSWNISNANCADMGITTNYDGMVVDPTKTSGTRLAGGGMGWGGSPPCSAPMTGSLQVSNQIPFIGYGHRGYWIMANNTLGKSAASSQWIDILTVPQLKGSSTAARVSDIRSALKTIDKLLRDGCIYNNTGLDASVPAFKNGHIKRTEFWARLLAELQNIKLDTFNCQDVADNKWGGGHWSDYSNEIILDWSPSHTPYLEYVILHELTHKCGFNGELTKFYSQSDIENQTADVSGSCFP